MPHAEPAIIIEKPKVEKKRSTSLEGSCASPAAVPKEDKRKLSVTKEPGKAQKSKHVSKMFDTVGFVQLYNLFYVVHTFVSATFSPTKIEKESTHQR